MNTKYKLSILKIVRSKKGLLMKKKIIITLVCLFSILGIVSYCVVNSKTKVSEQVNDVSKQETKIVKETSKPIVNKDKNEEKVTTVSKQNSTKTECSKDTSSSQSKKNTSSKVVVNSNEKKTTNDIVVNESNQNTSKQEVIEEVKVQEVIPEPTVEPTPVPVEPSYACPGGVDPNQACDVILDKNSYYATFSSEGEANSSGEYYLNDVMYIGETEITNYSVQPVYRNDHSIAYYGLNLWSNGSLIN